MATRRRARQGQRNLAHAPPGTRTRTDGTRRAGKHAATTTAAAPPQGGRRTYGDSKRVLGDPRSANAEAGADLFSQISLAAINRAQRAMLQHMV
jgi:hypothetical protein